MRLIFPWSVRTSGGVGRPWMRERWRNHRDRRGGFSCLQGALLDYNMNGNYLKNSGHPRSWSFSVKII